MQKKINQNVDKYSCQRSSSHRQNIRNTIPGLPKSDFKKSVHRGPVGLLFCYWVPGLLLLWTWPSFIALHWSNLPIKAFVNNIDQLLCQNIHLGNPKTILLIWSLLWSRCLCHCCELGLPPPPLRQLGHKSRWHQRGRSTKVLDRGLVNILIKVNNRTNLEKNGTLFSVFTCAILQLSQTYGGIAFWPKKSWLAEKE